MLIDLWDLVFWFCDSVRLLHLRYHFAHGVGLFLLCFWVSVSRNQLLCEHMSSVCIPRFVVLAGYKEFKPVIEDSF